ncbi:hypothetical protein T11_6988 [Trichinella zimbabwensis]|uniref:Uncharacterized protein n=1 Tax=Trichinella zimbabwensis TaxID=268475 RepID=A0A0V1HR01_9BILA|nr:hypothetical protein T11_6988 [Trichinella zimbabwensis]
MQHLKILFLLDICLIQIETDSNRQRGKLYIGECELAQSLAADWSRPGAGMCISCGCRSRQALLSAQEVIVSRHETDRVVAFSTSAFLSTLRPAPD